MSRNGTKAQAFEAESVLQVYSLGMVEFEAALALQRRLHYEISGSRNQGALLLCEHPPLITVGRHGSRAHILCEADELRARQWRIRWVNRGGGCLLHSTGQLAIYAILALDRLSLNLPEYISNLQAVLVDVLDDFSVTAEPCGGPPGVAVRSRLVAGVGVAVRDWVSYYGAFLNIDADLSPHRLVRWGGVEQEPMTSLVRERRSPLRPALVRERLIEHFAERFAFSRTAFFSSHPSLVANQAKRRLTSA